MNKSSKFYILLCATALVFPGSASAVRAQDAELAAAQTAAAPFKKEVSSEDKVVIGAQNFITSMGHRAIDFLGNENLSHEERTNEFRKLLSDSFSMPTLGRFALGRYWRVSTAQQKKEYMTLFEEMIVRVYSKRFTDYQGQKFEVRGARPESKKDTVVTSYILPETGPEIQVDWRVRYKNGRYKVVDIIVEGVSMAVTQRSDFASVIQRGGGNVGVLIEHLRK